MINYINLTPDTVNINKDGKIISYEPSGVIAEQDVYEIYLCSIDGVKCYAKTWNNIIGLPNQTPNTVFIVSDLVKSRTNRQDVVSPNNNESAIRDHLGYIVAITSWII